MAVAWTQLATWGPATTTGDWQTNYWRIPFAGLPHIVASAYINYVSLGAHDGTGGGALAAFKRFEFIDDNGRLQETEVTEIVALLEVQRCVSITVALDFGDATVCAGWSFHTLT